VLGLVCADDEVPHPELTAVAEEPAKQKHTYKTSNYLHQWANTNCIPFIYHLGLFKIQNINV